MLRREFVGAVGAAAITAGCTGAPRRWSSSPSSASDTLSSIPRPVLDADPDLLALYEFAWESALRHVRSDAGMPQTPYMDEAFDPGTIWIWDTCFMVQFCRYAPPRLPGIQSLRNFYVPILDQKPIPLRIEIPDNPPLFAWTELEHFRMTGDHEHVRQLLLETRYLQRHFDWFEHCRPGVVIADSAPTFLQKVANGYHWEGGRSGMDNTPRGRTGRNAIRQRPNNPHLLWIDAIAQQALAARSIARLAESIGEQALAAQWNTTHAAFAKQINDMYWDEADGMYYDLDERDLKPIKVLTPASFWPVLAEVASPKQVERMLSALKDPQRLGGAVPWVSLARDDADFNPRGGYWRGGLWLGVAYMGIKGLQKYGHLDMAHEQATTIVRHMARTYRDFSPHTIWEAYSPTTPAPSNNESEGDMLVRQDFCGWSALGPISMLIECILGFHDIDAVARTVRWHKRRTDRHGIRNLAFGDVLTDIIADGDRIEITSNAPYTLRVGERAIQVEAGSRSYR